MGDYTHEIKISKLPIEASEDWEEVSVTNKKKCGKCNSENVICICEFAEGCIIG